MFKPVRVATDDIKEGEGTLRVNEEAGVMELAAALVARASDSTALLAREEVEGGAAPVAA